MSFFKVTCPRCSYGNFQETPFTEGLFECRSCGLELNIDHQVQVNEGDETRAPVLEASAQENVASTGSKRSIKIVSICVIVLAVIVALAYWSPFGPSAPLHAIQRSFRDIKWYRQPAGYPSIDGAWRGYDFQGSKSLESGSIFGLDFASIRDFRRAWPELTHFTTFGQVFQGNADKNVVSEGSPASTYFFHKQFGFYKWTGALGRFTGLKEIEAAAGKITEELGVPVQTTITPENIRVWRWCLPPIEVKIFWTDPAVPHPLLPNYIFVGDVVVCSKLEENTKDATAKTGF